MNKRQRKKKLKKEVYNRLKGKLDSFVCVKATDGALELFKRQVEDELHKIFDERYPRAEMVTITGVIGER